MGNLSELTLKGPLIFADRMHTGNTVDIKVGAFIRQWVIAYHGSELIQVDKKMNLWAIVRQHLDTLPKDAPDITDRSEYISLELLDTSGTLIYNLPSGRKMYMDSMFRYYIDDAGQAAIERYLSNQFRAHFRTYMTARFSDGRKEPIRHAIGSFLSDYLLPCDDIIMSRLSKDWYRHRQKNPEKYPIPIIF